MPSTLVRREEAPRFEVHGAQVEGYASPSRGSQAIAAWRLTLAPGVSSPTHSLEGDEIFLALSGEAEFRFGDERLVVRAGDCLTVHGGTQFSLGARGSEPFEAIACARAGTRASVAGGAPFLPPWAA